MKVVIQRVSSAAVTIDNQIVATIQSGLLVLVGFEATDTHEDLTWMTSKIANLRIFNDENQVMNLSVQKVKRRNFVYQRGLNLICGVLAQSPIVLP